MSLIADRISLFVRLSYTITGGPKVAAFRSFLDRKSAPFLIA